MQKVYLPSSFTKCNENCGLPDVLTDYQIRHLSNPSGLPEMLPKIDPCFDTEMSPVFQSLNNYYRLRRQDSMLGNHDVCILADD